MKTIDKLKRLRDELNNEEETHIVIGRVLSRLDAIIEAEGDGWIKLKDKLPEAGQKVDLWLVPEDEEKSHRISWTWEKESTAEITISGCKVEYWMPSPQPPKQS